MKYVEYCVLHATSGLFLYCGLYSRKRSIVKDADVDLIIFIKPMIKVLFVAL